MTLGLTIPGVPDEDIFPRETWEKDGWRMATSFHRTPTPYRPDRVTRLIAHYTAALNLPDGDPGETQAQLGPRLLNSQQDYLKNRKDGGYRRVSDGMWFPGYPLGYGWGFDVWGGVWEIRGFDFLPAATNAHNAYTAAFLFFVDGADKATPLMWKRARAVGREVRRRSQRADFNPYFTDHGTVFLDTGVGTPTACAGAGIRSQLRREGYIDLDNIEEGVPPMAVCNNVRLLDTRTHPHYRRKLNAGEVITVLVPGEGPSARPAWAGAARIRITSTEANGPGFITVWDGVGPMPDDRADVNWDRAGGTEASMADAELSGHAFKLFTTVETHVIVELRGYDSKL